MASPLFDKWCETKAIQVEGRHNLHLFRERDGVRSSVTGQIDSTVASHYEDPVRLSERIARVGLRVPKERAPGIWVKSLRLKQPLLY
jgi:hypothetical protein